MTAYDNEKRGVLFKNDQRGNDKAPLYKGTCEIEGVEYEMAAWIRTARSSSEKYMSIKFERKGAQQARSGGAAPAAAPADTTPEATPEPTYGIEGHNPDEIPF